MKHVKTKIICVVCAMLMCTVLMFIGVMSALNQTAMFTGNFGFAATNTEDNVDATVVLSTNGALTDINSTISFDAGEASQTKTNANLNAEIGANGILTFTVTVTNTNTSGNIKADIVSTLIDGTNYTVSAITSTGTTSIAPGESGTFVFSVTVTNMLQSVSVTDFELTINLEAI